MADEIEKIPAGSRFRLPKFFGQGAEAGTEESLSETDALSPGAPQAAREAEAPAPRVGTSVFPPNSVFTRGESVFSRGNRAEKDRDKGAEKVPDDVGSQLAAMQEALHGIADQVAQVNERETALERVFDALHAELADYKNDFLYEHLKPVVRPLLFLFDSLEQFDGEVAMAEATMTGEAHGEILAPPVVRENVRYFRDQLIEALRSCEVTIMDTPSGTFNAKLQKAVDVMPVAEAEDNQIVRVVRSGWFLNGQLLRPAEVVVGKFRGS